MEQSQLVALGREPRKHVPSRQDRRKPLQPLQRGPAPPIEDHSSFYVDKNVKSSGQHGRNRRNLSIETRGSLVRSEKSSDILDYYLDDEPGRVSCNISRLPKLPSAEALSAFNFELEERDRRLEARKVVKLTLMDHIDEAASVDKPVSATQSRPGPPSRRPTYSLFPSSISPSSSSASDQAGESPYHPVDQTFIAPLPRTRNFDSISSHARSDSGASAPLFTDPFSSLPSNLQTHRPQRPRIARVRSETVGTVDSFAVSATAARPSLSSMGRSRSSTTTTTHSRWSSDTASRPLLSSGSRAVSFSTPRAPHVYSPPSLPATPYEPDTPVRSMFLTSPASSSPSTSPDSSPGCGTAGRWSGWRRKLSAASSIGYGIREIETGESLVLVRGESGKDKLVAQKRPVFRKPVKRRSWCGLQSCFG
ncbi:hypothetical protein ANO11243_013180 [Dothideomycetidae sp. 11243]|nr:hypothetical protein ANO11243_013180 [fungal sp. No.11243]